MSEGNNALTVIPAELKNQLPIFQVLGDKLPAAITEPQGKKTIASIFYWALIIGGAYWFFTNLDVLLDYAQKSVLFIVFSILFLVLLFLAPKIISVEKARSGSTKYRATPKIIKSAASAIKFVTVAITPITIVITP